MAVLVQLPGTRLSRVALLPVVLWMALRAGMSMDFSWNSPTLGHLNHGLALAMFTLAMRSTVWMLVREPYARLPIHGSPRVSVPSAMWNACDLILNLRGIGWNWAQGSHIPKASFQVESRLVFFVLSLCRLILSTIAFDTASRCVSWFGPDTFGSPNGGTIFDSSLPPFTRYLRSSVITILAGVTSYFTIEAVYQLHAVEFTVLFRQYPSQWPPLFDAPWFSTSLSSFWGRRWHQLFRESFVAIGSKPLEVFFGRAGIVMGAFAVSGALHDVGMRGMGRGPDSLQVMGFFLMHGVGVMMEGVWKRVTGRRVGGLVGWLWVVTWFVIWGNLMVDAWARRGLLGCELIPQPYRPTTMLLNLLYSGR
ncbi:hypothetical protein BDN67DRAFT_901941 [Paxillus ammoniavirescens]|nr:hypothetical protein BDN67DRAFT_901941 [Paxillus ammoniavirescens]